MIRAFFKGIKIELIILIIILLTMLGLIIYKHNGTRLQQALESLNQQLHSLENQNKIYSARRKELEKQFSYIVNQKNRHNYTISKSDINDLLAQHTITYALKYSGNRESLALTESKNDQLTWVAEDLHLSLLIKHELALLQFFKEMQRRFATYIDLKNCDMKRVSTDQKIEGVTVQCTLKLYTIA